ncbi:RICIN domain-containing protein [Streptomyces sp. NPDC050535]|uniref:RICIN domain-containing protein n=1 Tax=Streptomyces sp. NPDC050535 TaxID=3365626 RepID=UPI0037B0399A
MMQKMARKVLAAATAFGLGAAFAVASAGSASAYQPSQTNLYVSQDSATCSKKPCVLYPKSAQLPSGRIVASFENSKGDPVGQTLPVHKSDDDGTTWQKLTDVKAPAALSSDPKYAKYTSNWTNPYLYVLPQDVGSLTAGTLLLASVVSGDDYYYKERKAADPNWTADGDGDRKDVAIALYSSTDDGATWSIQNIIAAGGWQGSRVSNANTNRQSDPLWEPYLIARNGQLVAYYSDEHDYLGFDATTGVPARDPDDDTATDSYNQILVHATWDGTSAAWTQPIVDVPGTTENLNGKTLIGNGRPGMTTIAPTTDGRWLLTYEYWGGGTNVRYRLADDPLKFSPNSVTDLPVTNLPVPSGGHALSTSGSPVLAPLPDGRILYNAASSGSVWVNESGRSDGTWKEYQTPVTGGYSRNLQYVEDTRRVVILQADFGSGYGPIRYGEVDLGRSQGAYSTLVNRATGQALSPDAGKTQDANLTGNVPDLVLRNRAATDDTQRWHLTAKGNDVTLLNKAGGRSAAIWTGSATAGQKLAQWVDDGATDKQWTLVPSTDGYYKIRSVRGTSLFMTGATQNGSVDLEASIDASGNPSADDAQEWQLVQDPLPTDTNFTLKGANSGRCLDVPNGLTGVQVQIYDCSGNANQTITQTAAGELRVAGKCLAADADGTTPGTRLILWSCNGKSSQKWWFRLDGSVINRSNGHALDVTNSATANGSKVQLWTALGNATQRWSRG